MRLLEFFGAPEHPSFLKKEIVLSSSDLLLVEGPFDNLVQKFGHGLRKAAGSAWDSLKRASYGPENISVPKQPDWRSMRSKKQKNPGSADQPVSTDDPRLAALSGDEREAARLQIELQRRLTAANLLYRFNKVKPQHPFGKGTSRVPKARYTGKYRGWIKYVLTAQNGKPLYPYFVLVDPRNNEAVPFLRREYHGKEKEVADMLSRPMPAPADSKPTISDEEEISNSQKQAPAQPPQSPKSPPAQPQTSAPKVPTPAQPSSPKTPEKKSDDERLRAAQEKLKAQGFGGRKG